MPLFFTASEIAEHPLHVNVPEPPPEPELPLDDAPVTPVLTYFEVVLQLYVNHEPFVLKENVAVPLPRDPSASTIMTTFTATHARRTIAKP